MDLLGLNIGLRRKKQQAAKTVHTLRWVSVFVRTKRQGSVTLLASYVCVPHLQKQHTKRTKFMTNYFKFVGARRL